ncbi:MAG: hypothetical protein M0P95_18000 [Sulfuritalea sp.]|jgi:hypothetical protein|nr:hypothetical protein [Sulfuritalea sp.]
MLDLPCKLDDIFREFSRGRHLSAQDGDIYIALEQRPDDYILLFGRLGFELVHDARGFYYFAGSNRGIAGGIQRLALFVYILIDWLADSGESITEALAGKAFAVDALPHLASDRYRGYLAHVDVENADGLADIIRTMDNFGFAKQMGDGSFRFLPPVHRIVDACIASNRETVPTDVTQEPESC